MIMERIPSLVVGVFCTDSMRRVCLVQTAKVPLGLTIPGGHVRYGETIVACAVREMREESGTALQNPAVRSWGEIILPGRHEVYFNLLGTTESPSILPEDSLEILAVYWIPVCDAVSDVRIPPRIRDEIITLLSS